MTVMETGVSIAGIKAPISNSGVPGEYESIELAIDAASPGAVIAIAAGTFTLTVSLDTLGKAITLRGAIDRDGTPITIIDGAGVIRVLECRLGEAGDTVFENLRVQSGSSPRGGRDVQHLQ